MVCWNLNQLCPLLTETRDNRVQWIMVMGNGEIVEGLPVAAADLVAVVVADAVTMEAAVVEAMVLAAAGPKSAGARAVD